MEFKAARLLPVAEILYEIEGDPGVTRRLAQADPRLPAGRLPRGDRPAWDAARREPA